jgi:hypothetical protein
MPPETDRLRDRDHLLDRLQHPRAIVPVFAQELASARRQAARLRPELHAPLERIVAHMSVEPAGVVSGLDIVDAVGSSADLAT